MATVKSPAAASPPTAAQIRSDIMGHLRTITTAWSLSGRDVGFMTDFESGLEVGAFAIVTTPGGRRLLMQVHDVQVREREALRLDVDTGALGDTAGAALLGANLGMVTRFVAGTAQVLARVDADGGLAPAEFEGFSEGSIELAPTEMVSALLTGSLGESVGLNIGATLAAHAPALLKASGFSRHTLMVGQSGSGKTYSLGLLLERLLVDTTLPMIVLDPNSDYVHLGELRPREAIAPRGGAPMSVRAYRELKQAMRSAGEVVVAGAGSAALPLRIHLSDLSLHEQALTLGLDPLADSAEYGAFIDAVEALVPLERYGFDGLLAQLEGRHGESAAKLVHRIRNLRVAEWSVWAGTEEPSLVAGVRSKRLLVLDTGSLDDERERSVVALAVMGILRRRPTRTPMLLVIDEAHNVLSPEAESDLQRAITEYGVWIAGEGRKYGLHMVVSTQRPQKVHRNVISQCDNLVLMRMNSHADIEELAAIFSHVPRAMIEEAHAFVQGEMLVAGPIATPPVRVLTGVRWCPEGGADLPTDWASGRRG